jgi:hypothetical protein
MVTYQRSYAVIYGNQQIAALAIKSDVTKPELLRHIYYRTASD